ncbi:MAG: transcription-repair coupling factor [Alphaproteobacteria bacterium]|nr:transcription-repair coupling factor [Alphaproteobacteria bacterium]
MKIISGVPEGYDALMLAKLAKEHGNVLHIALSDVRLAWLAEGIKFFAPDIEVLIFPAWDTVPYDRVSPNINIISERVSTLAKLTASPKPSTPRVVLTTVNASLQRLPPKEFFAGASFAIKVGADINLAALQSFLDKNGYARSQQVMDEGEYAIRGGIFDIFPAGEENPLRLDFFGDEIEAIRTFDAVTQRSIGNIGEFVFTPASEIALTEETIAAFRKSYREMFGSMIAGDVLYESISEGRRFSGMEHWLPLFYSKLETLFAYLPDVFITTDFQAEQAAKSRQEQIAEFYDARMEALKSNNPLEEGGFKYRPVPPVSMFIPEAEYAGVLSSENAYELSPFYVGDNLAKEAKPAHDFADVRVQVDVDLFSEVKKYLNEEIKSGKRAFIAAFSSGTAERLSHLFKERGISIPIYLSFAEAMLAPSDLIGIVILPMERGFVSNDLCIITEQDILGDKIVRPMRKKRKNDDFISDISVLNEGDLVVHIEHGIGRYQGLQTIEAGGAPHDCLCIIYADEDKLFVPVENIEVLSRFGSEDAGVNLDRLGGQGWQMRKARLKKRIREIAAKLMNIAAERYLRKSEPMTVPEGIYEEFAARFPYMETDDQQAAIDDVLTDLSSEQPMDRLVCGDVGFGKTEVALRAAFVAAMAGFQVAIVVPTTLLARQHYETFIQRFKGLPVRIGQLSRMVSAKEMAEVKKELAEGRMEIVVGTHALLHKGISFANLGLIVVDEEQHFGVAHKERLKELRSNVHILTLTATPIPRTLQMALAGVREMSIIATPPIDRLAVRTFVLPFDGVIIREAILREHFRGGQVFYVCPRVSDIAEVEETLKSLVPEVKIISAHGQMSSTVLEKTILSFADHKYDVLVATSIIESGIDMPTVNTIIVHRADMFGLSQLYQLRGRVGRSKLRAYAYLTVPSETKKLTKMAQKRLSVMQTLDSLGEGFNLASYDLDIRGAGNLLGEEQSGHIKEVGIELYQQMLEEAIASLKTGTSEETEDKWSPQINTGMPILIPEKYVADLSVRLSLYRRLADLSSKAEVEAMASEIIDRFGKLPPEVENLLDIILIKAQCRIANIEKIDAGEKGAVITLHNNTFPKPEALIAFIAEQSGTAKVRPDNKIVYKRNWEKPVDRINGIRFLATKLAELAK